MAERVKPGTRKLSEVARHVVKPSGIVATDWPGIRDSCRDKLGVKFDTWQDGIGRLILARRADGKLAAMVGGVGMSLPRQVGKTYLLAGLIFALCVEKPGLLVIWSAHHARTHGETFLSMQGFAGRAKVKPWVEQVFKGSGDEEIRFHNGSRILFGARERGFGRGIPGVDVLIMDEAQILSDKALENMLATLNTSQFGLQLYIGTPPRPEDNSEAFTRMRTEALSGESDDLVWVECGADPDADLTDRKQWAKANPSFPHRTPIESMLRLQKKLKADGFRHEGLGIWDDHSTKTLAMPTWPACATRSDAPAPTCLAVAHDVDRVWISVAAASTAGEVPYLGAVLRVRAGTGRHQALAEVARICRERGIPVAVDAKDAPLLEDLQALPDAPETITASFDDYVQGCADLFDAVEAKEIEHGDHDDLNVAVAAAGWSNGERRKWAPKSGDVSMLKAATLAFWGAGQDRESVYESRGMVSL